MCDGEGRTTSLELLLQVFDEFVAHPTGERSPFEIGEQLIRLRHGIDLLELRFARDAAVFAATEEAVAQGSTSPIDWVRHRCGMSANAAARSIATGEVADQLPASVAALDAGRIGCIVSTTPMRVGETTVRPRRARACMVAQSRP